MLGIFAWKYEWLAHPRNNYLEILSEIKKLILFELANLFLGIDSREVPTLALKVAHLGKLVVVVFMLGQVGVNLSFIIRKVET